MSVGGLNRHTHYLVHTPTYPRPLVEGTASDPGKSKASRVVTNHSYGDVKVAGLHREGLVMQPEGLEPPTPWFVARYSNPAELRLHETSFGCDPAETRKAPVPWREPGPFCASGACMATPSRGLRSRYCRAVQCAHSASHTRAHRPHRPYPVGECRLRWWWRRRRSSCFLVLLRYSITTTAPTT